MSTISKRATLIISLLSALNLYGQVSDKDTTIKNFQLEGVTIITTPKETYFLNQLPASTSIIGGAEVESGGKNSIKGLSSSVPNLFIPDYGSKITSAIFTGISASQIPKAQTGEELYKSVFLTGAAGTLLGSQYVKLTLRDLNIPQEKGIKLLDLAEEKQPSVLSLGKDIEVTYHGTTESIRKEILKTGLKMTASTFARSPVKFPFLSFMALPRNLVSALISL